jgi:hypothetical protein
LDAKRPTLRPPARKRGRLLPGRPVFSMRSR